MNTPARGRALSVQAHVLRALAEASSDGRTLYLGDLTEVVSAPRDEIRSAVSELHIDGFVDALRMRLTASGFLFGTHLGKQNLTPLVSAVRKVGGGKPAQPNAARVSVAKRRAA